MIKLINDDCISILQRMANANFKVDAVITDPPYLIDYKTNRRKNKDHEFASAIKGDKEFDFEKWAHLIDKVLKDNSPLYIFGSWKTEPTFREVFRQYWNHKNNIVWVKNNHTAGDLQAQYGQKYELIYLYNKGRSKFHVKRYTDVWEFDKISGKSQQHQNQKPVDLLERIVTNATQEGDSILDPFMGSGSTGVACKKHNRKFIGVEIESNYFEIAKDRIL